MTAFSSKWKYEKLAVLVHVPQTTQNLVLLLAFENQIANSHILSQQISIYLLMNFTTTFAISL